MFLVSIILDEYGILPNLVKTKTSVSNLKLFIPVISLHLWNV